jgi:hypothetical protein
MTGLVFRPHRGADPRGRDAIRCHQIIILYEWLSAAGRKCPCPAPAWEDFLPVFHLVTDSMTPPRHPGAATHPVGPAGCQDVKPR